jgi:hypothetical protein
MHVLHLLNNTDCLKMVFPMIQSLLVQIKNKSKGLSEKSQQLEHCVSIMWSLIQGLVTA